MTEDAIALAAQNHRDVATKATMQRLLPSRLGCKSREWDVMSDFNGHHLVAPPCLNGTLHDFLTLFWTVTFGDGKVCTERGSRFWYNAWCCVSFFYL